MTDEEVAEAVRRLRAGELIHWDRVLTQDEIDRITDEYLRTSSD